MDVPDLIGIETVVCHAFIEKAAQWIHHFGIFGEATWPWLLNTADHVTFTIASVSIHVEMTVRRKHVDEIPA